MNAAPVPRRPHRGRRLVWAAAGSWLLLVLAHRLLSGRLWWWNLPDLLPPLLFLAVPVLLLALVPLARPATTADPSRPRTTDATPTADPTRPGAADATPTVDETPTRTAGPRVVVAARPRVVAVALALASLAVGWPYTGVNVAAGRHRPPPAPAGAVTVFSWNTWYWDELLTAGPDGERIRDPDGFYRFLHARAADVYLLQEYLYVEPGDWDPIRLDDLARIRREFPGHHVAISGELVTISRYPIVLERPLDLRPGLQRRWPDLPPADSALPDYHTVKTLRTDLLVGGRVFSVYNAHLHVPPLGLPTRHPETEDDALARHDLRRAAYRTIAADVAANPNPVLLAGDLNTSPGMGLLRTLPARLVDAGSALDAAYPTSWAWHGLPLWRLDWVFTSSDVRVHRYRMVPPDGRSDHHGQHVVVSL